MFFWRGWGTVLLDKNCEVIHCVRLKCIRFFKFRWAAQWREPGGRLIWSWPKQLSMKGPPAVLDCQEFNPVVSWTWVSSRKCLIQHHEELKMFLFLSDLQEAPVVSFVRDAHEKKRQIVHAKRQQLPRWQKIQQNSAELLGRDVVSPTLAATHNAETPAPSQDSVEIDTHKGVVVNTIMLTLLSVCLRHSSHWRPSLVCALKWTRHQEVSERFV